MTKHAYRLDYHKCQTSELRKFIYDRTGTWPLIRHGRRSYIKQLHDLDRNRKFTRFTHLPPEVRDQVYGHLVLPETRAERQQRSKLARLPRVKHRYLDILRTSRALSREAEDVLHLNNPLKMTIINQRVWCPELGSGKYKCIFDGVVSEETSRKLRQPWSLKLVEMIRSILKNPLGDFTFSERFKKARHFDIEIRHVDVVYRVPIQCAACPEDWRLVPLNRLLCKMTCLLYLNTDVKTVAFTYHAGRGFHNIASLTKMVDALYPLAQIGALRPRVNWMRFSGFPKLFWERLHDMQRLKKLTGGLYARAERLLHETEFILSQVEEESDERRAAALGFVSFAVLELKSSLRGTKLVTLDVEERVREPLRRLIESLSRAKALGLLEGLLAKALLVKKVLTMRSGS